MSVTVAQNELDFFKKDILALARLMNSVPPMNVASSTSDGGSNSDATPDVASADFAIWLSRKKGNGLIIEGRFAFVNNEPKAVVCFKNRTPNVITEIEIKLSHYFYSYEMVSKETIEIGSEGTILVPLTSTYLSPQLLESLDSLKVEVKCNGARHELTVKIPFQFCVKDIGAPSRSEYAILWREIPAKKRAAILKNELQKVDRNAIITKTKENNIATVGRFDEDGMSVVWQSYKLPNDVWVLLKWDINSDDRAILTVKSESHDFSWKTFEIVDNIIRG